LHAYSPQFVAHFTTAYYIATDLGSLTAGFVTLALVRWLLPLHASRMVTFLLFALLVLLTFVAAWMPKGWWLLGVLLLIGFRSLGVFPTYSSLAQELSSKHQGKVAGTLGCICWIGMAVLRETEGWSTKTFGYQWCIAFAGIPPVLAFIVLLAFWRSPRAAPAPQVAPPAAEPEAAAVPS